MVRPGRTHRSGVALEGGNAGSCAGLSNVGGNGCVLNADVALHKEQLSADLRNLQKVGPPRTAPARALLQRRREPCAPTGTHNSSTADVLGVAQKRCAGGPTAARDVFEQRSTKEDTEATKEGDPRRRGSRSKKDKRERQRAVGLETKLSPPYQRNSDRGEARLASGMAMTRCTPASVPKDVERGQREESRRSSDGEGKRIDCRGKGEKEDMSRPSPVKPRLVWAGIGEDHEAENEQ